MPVSISDDDNPSCMQTLTFHAEYKSIFKTACLVSVGSVCHIEYCQQIAACLLIVSHGNVAEVLQASVREEKRLLVENAKLKNDIEDLKRLLLEKQKSRAGREAPVTAKLDHSRPACLRYGCAGLLAV